MLYQMLSGVLPFRGESMAELMYKIANEQAPDIRTVRKDLPDRLAQVVAYALQKSPENRYQDGVTMAIDLQAALVGEGDATARTAQGNPSAPAFQATLKLDRHSDKDHQKTVIEPRNGQDRLPS